MCSLRHLDAPGQALSRWTQSHWVRDVTFAEDASRVRTGHAPRVMATPQSTVISLLRRTGIRVSPRRSGSTGGIPSAHHFWSALLTNDFDGAVQPRRSAVPKLLL